MNFHLEQKFPSAVRSLVRLAEHDNELASLLADYEELCTWVAAQDRSSKTVDAEIRVARELIGELENEIRRQMGER